MADLVMTRFVGMVELLAVLERLGDRALPALGAALAAEAEMIMTDSKTNFVPVDTGSLRASGHVERPKYSGNTVSVTLGFGDDATGYAREVHENLSARHTVGGAKYLEIPMGNALPGMPGRLANRLKGIV